MAPWRILNFQVCFWFVHVLCPCCLCLTRSLGCLGTISLEWFKKKKRRSWFYLDRVFVCVCCEYKCVVYLSVWCPQPRAPLLSSPAAAAFHMWWGIVGQPVACQIAGKSVPLLSTDTLLVIILIYLFYLGLLQQQQRLLPVLAELHLWDDLGETETAATYKGELVDLSDQYVIWTDPFTLLTRCLGCKEKSIQRLTVEHTFIDKAHTDKAWLILTSKSIWFLIVPQIRDLVIINIID